MARDERERDEEFARRISGPLRAVERGDESFTERVMSAVRLAAEDQRAESRRHWLLRPRLVSITPLAALALAAGVALLAIGGDAMLSRGRTTPVMASADTVHVVRFVFVEGEAQPARSVQLVGSFNNWAKGSLELTPHAGTGVWSVSIPLSSGRHDYAFVVVDSSGERWVADPAALRIRDEFGAETSVLTVGTT